MNELQTRQLYLNLMKSCLTGLIYEDRPTAFVGIGGYAAVPRTGFVRKLREFGRDAPENAHTLIGLRRLNNLQSCIEQVLANNIPGDLIETGVWRGGAVIMMRAVLKDERDEGIRLGLFKRFLTRRRCGSEGLAYKVIEKVFSVRRLHDPDTNF